MTQMYEFYEFFNNLRHSSIIKFMKYDFLLTANCVVQAPLQEPLYALLIDFYRGVISCMPPNG